MQYNLITILGPTAVGKTSLAAQLAFEFRGEIISADSRQVYKGMDIGTGKDLKDYFVDGKEIPYHIIDIISPQEEFNLFLFLKHFYNSFRIIKEDNKVPFLVGGTGLYLDAVLHSYSLKEVQDLKSFSWLNELSLEELKERLLKLNPKLHNTTDILDKERIISAIMIAEAKDANLSIKKEKISSLVIGINADRKLVKERITKRLKDRLNGGMIDEVKMLIESGVSHEKLSFFGLEYKFVSLYLQGQLNYNDMYQKLNSSIHDFAKRQMTWFRKMEREGIKIHWIDGPDIEKAKEIIMKYFSI
ncbi:MAG: tRNA (adenosine(37)-N6)-dimethylallyltransferase MiaA [Bacteroidota bacterium]|nr:tRNA (adenosine(37)-N6)-dimethylallyltransferase MiaA [Bacteroidota bacterium]MDP4191343.1 tRNA (adenosine(37)-N6)-dimethylallyltransferase MiaA [Bacteroidota bacterium]MDP4195886.1 tRNA (adenosine(37)-N6)-dimethylallyltransferase MiaA [Bacteroidota bacterium]